MLSELGSFDHAGQSIVAFESGDHVRKEAVSFRPLTGPIRAHRNPQRKRFKIRRIGRLNVRLTGQLFGRALNLLTKFDIAHQRG